MAFLGVVAVLCLGLALVEGHGRLLDPIGRSSLWRFGYRVPANYDDSGMNCGGRWEQYGVNGGKCGPCGDSYSLPTPRSNENTGMYGKGIVAKTFKSGDVVPLTVLITANHMGWFEFNLCPLASKDQVETEDCFDKYPLQLADGSGTRYQLGSGATGKYDVKVKLPDGVKCDLCVIRWHYRTGNSWGVCPDGSGNMGCGDQETFRNCADVAIA